VKRRVVVLGVGGSRGLDALAELFVAVLDGRLGPPFLIDG